MNARVAIPLLDGAPPRGPPPSTKLARLLSLPPSLPEVLTPKNILFLNHHNHNILYIIV